MLVNKKINPRPLSREETETVKRLLDRMYDNIKDETEEEET